APPASLLCGTPALRDSPSAPPGRGHSRKPPLYVFPDMEWQPKLRPQTPNEFFTNGLSSQLPVAGTIPRGTPIHTTSGDVFPYEDAPVNTGRLPGSTNFVELNPLPVTAQLLSPRQQP